MRYQYSEDVKIPAANMVEVLLARGNGVKLVNVHLGRISKVTPVSSETDVCARVKRSGALVDNAEKMAQLLGETFGEYMVTVCHGQIMSVERVMKEEAVKVQEIESVDIEELDMQAGAELMAKRARRGK